MMGNDFVLNRYDFSSLIESIQSLEALPRVLTDNETGVEFYGSNKVAKDDFIDFLKTFNEIDNIIQEESKKDYEKQRKFTLKSYQFEPSWVEVTPDKVSVGYVGKYTNTDFSVVFININHKWKLLK